MARFLQPQRSAELISSIPFFGEKTKISRSNSVRLPDSHHKPNISGYEPKKQDVKTKTRSWTRLASKTRRLTLGMKVGRSISEVYNGDVSPLLPVSSVEADTKTESSRSAELSASNSTMEADVGVIKSTCHEQIDAILIMEALPPTNSSHKTHNGISPSSSKQSGLAKLSRQGVLQYNKLEEQQNRPRALRRAAIKGLFEQGPISREDLSTEDPSELGSKEHQFKSSSQSKSNVIEENDISEQDPTNQSIQRQLHLIHRDFEISDNCNDVILLTKSDPMLQMDSAEADESPTCKKSHSLEVSISSYLSGTSSTCIFEDFARHLESLERGGNREEKWRMICKFLNVESEDIWKWPPSVPQSCQAAKVERPVEGIPKMNESLQNNEKLPPRLVLDFIGPGSVSKKFVH